MTGSTEYVYMYIDIYWHIYDSFYWRHFLPEICQIEKLRFLGISLYKFKLRCWINLNLYRGLWVSRFGGFCGFGIFSGICHTHISIHTHTSQICIYIYNMYTYSYITDTYMYICIYICIYTHTSRISSSSRVNKLCFFSFPGRQSIRQRRHCRHCSTPQHTAAHCSSLQHTAAHCSTLQHTAAHCSTLQHTATYMDQQTTSKLQVVWGLVIHRSVCCSCVAGVSCSCDMQLWCSCVLQFCNPSLSVLQLCCSWVAVASCSCVAVVCYNFVAIVLCCGVWGQDYKNTSKLWLFAILRRRIVWITNMRIYIHIYVVCCSCVAAVLQLSCSCELQLDY